MAQMPASRPILKPILNAITGAALCAALLAVDLAPAYAEMEPQPVARLRTLDKVTARTMTFEADVGSTVKFGPLFIKIRACEKAPPIEQPEAAAFLQIWEHDVKTEEPQWVFSGWMFASSPALSPMDHAIYDVWVLDCLAEKTGTAPETDPEAEDTGTDEDVPDDAPADAADSAPADNAGAENEQTPEETLPASE